MPSLKDLIFSVELEGILALLGINSDFSESLSILLEHPVNSRQRDSMDA